MTERGGAVSNLGGRSVAEAGAPEQAEHGVPGLAHAGSDPWTDAAPHPFRRWVARTFDFWITTGLAFALAGAPFAMAASGQEVMTIPVSLLIAVYVLPPMRGLATAALNYSKGEIKADTFFVCS